MQFHIIYFKEFKEQFHVLYCSSGHEFLEGNYIISFFLFPSKYKLHINKTKTKISSNSIQI